MLDANILMRAVLGRRVRELLERYEESAAFYSPTSALMTPATMWPKSSKNAVSTPNRGSVFSGR